MDSGKRILSQNILYATRLLGRVRKIKAEKEIKDNNAFTPNSKERGKKASMFQPLGWKMLLSKACFCLIDVSLHGQLLSRLIKTCSGYKDNRMLVFSV